MGWASVAVFCVSVFTIGNVALRPLAATRMTSFRIPSESMLPTLVVGDQFMAMADRARYPLVRGAVVVHFDAEHGVDYVKRIVGLQGDHVEWDGQTLFLNGKAWPS